MNGKIIIDLIVVGSLKEKGLRQLNDEYVKRLSKYSKLTIKEVKDESNNQLISDVLKKEAIKINKVLDQNSYIIVLDLKKEELTSEEFSKTLQEITTYQNSKITFIVGGSYGIDDEIKRKAQKSITFSKMTFPHQLFRIMLLEQIYRAFKIMEASPYHK